MRHRDAGTTNQRHWPIPWAVFVDGRGPWFVAGFRFTSHGSEFLLREAPRGPVVGTCRAPSNKVVRLHDGPRCGASMPQLGARRGAAVGYVW
jgi:hypothetical protein